MNMSEYSMDSFDSGIGDTSPRPGGYISSDSLDNVYHKRSNKGVQYISRSYIEMPQTGEVNYIATICQVHGNPLFGGPGVWLENSHRSTSTTVKVDKDDVRAKRHYVKTLNKDGREIKIWECGLCGKEFRFQYTLVRHIPTHTDVRNYQCDICPKAFRQLSTLAQHKATHWNMRPFSCEFCNKSFNRISTLISHKKIHYDEKKHVCDYCGKGFHQKGNLRNHMYTHTNERPYKCDICGKGFNQKSNLVCHKISTHSKKDNYNCEICNITFGKSNLFSCHMESIHGIEVNGFPTKRKTHSNLWEENSTSEPQCSIIDEANNVIYSLPVSIDKKDNITTALTTPDSLNHSKDEPSEEDEILAFVDQEPTGAMLNSYRNKQIPFVLYYANGAIQPAICKVEILNDGYLLKNPSKEDTMRYFNLNKVQKSTKFTFVATIFQKKDTFGSLQYLVIPAGIQSHITEKDEMTTEDNADQKITLHNENKAVVIIPENGLSIPLNTVNETDNGKSAIILTKTQPNIRNINSRKDIGHSKIIISADELTLPESLIITPELTSPIIKDEKMSIRQDIFICGTNGKGIDNKFGNLVTEGSTNKDRNNCQSSNFTKKIKSNPAKSIMFQQDILPIIKQEVVSEDETTNEAFEAYNSIEPSLFMTSDNLKEPLSKFHLEFEEEEKPLSKYNLDFGEDNLDLLDVYSFSEAFLENDSSSAMTEEPIIPDYLTTPHCSIGNPASPSYSLNPLA